MRVLLLRAALLLIAQSFANERELRRLAVLPPEDRVLAAAATGHAWCVEELFAQGCPVDRKCVSTYL